MPKISHYPANGWRLVYTEGSSNKFYEVYITENGVCVLRWGRMHTAGQHSATRYGSYEEARDVGLRQVFSKKSKGYVQQFGDFQFLASVEAIDYAVRGNPSKMAEEFGEALNKGMWDGAKTTVLKQYADFSEQVKLLMERADSGDFTSTMEEYTQLEKVWEEINDKHAEVSAAMSLAQMTLAQKLLSGSV